MKKKHKNGEKKDEPTPRERLEITLKYNRQYVSQRYLAVEYNVAKSFIGPIINWTMKIIVDSNSFSLFNKISNIYDNSEDRIIDAT